MKQLTGYEGAHCANCGVPMQGEFCHACGQSIHSVIKPVHGMLEDTLDIVFHVDGRIVHTLPPLLLRPGFLTLEYFGGRRVRYIAPFRLMFVLCLLAFFVFHLEIDRVATRLPPNGRPLVSVDSRAIETADSPAAVRAALQEQLDDLERAKESGVLPQNVLEQIRTGSQELRRAANRRLVELAAAPLAGASVPAPAAATTAVGGRTEAGATAPHKPDRSNFEQENPVQIRWLPDVVNARLTALAHQIAMNVKAFRQGDAAASAAARQRMISGVFSTLPPAMFVLMPVFALVLKLFYAFRRRLYMEHLIVALHSHAFLFLSLLLITLAGMLSNLLQPHAAWAGYPLGLLQAGLMAWMPVYLLIMQKRIYRQGWLMTGLKFWCVGWCYLWLLAAALMIAAALGMAH